jgi:hypothetical protein
VARVGVCRTGCACTAHTAHRHCAVICDNRNINLFLLVVKGPAADATGQHRFLCDPVLKMTSIIIIFYPFPSNGAPVE